MLDREKESIDMAFYERFTKGNHKVLVSPYAQYHQDRNSQLCRMLNTIANSEEDLSPSRGGFNCEEMGLGKTIEVDRLCFCVGCLMA